jgi:hypothetical protein
MGKPDLRAVQPGEAPPAKAKIPTLVEAIESGDPLTIALAQRRDIAASLPDEKGPAKAALYRQLMLVSKEIETLKLSAAQAAREDADAGPVEDETWNPEAL